MSDEPRREVGFPGVRATTVRLDDSLHAAVRAEAERQGTNPSDFIRQAVAFRVGWLAALRASGVDIPDDAALAQALAKLAAEPDVS
jgi:hypothetical protein